MARSVAMAALSLVIPALLFFGGVAGMAAASDQEHVKRRLADAAPPVDRKPLNMRVTGYDAAAVRRHWGALDPRALAAVRGLLKLDLIFPLVYGAGLAVGLLLAWSSLERPFSRAWLVLPVAITMVADWTENVVQLHQLARFQASAAHPLHAGMIRIASVATVVKLLLFGTTVVLLCTLAATAVLRRRGELETIARSAGA
jgi:hypothetical protein